MQHVTKSTGFRYDIENGAVVVRRGKDDQVNHETLSYQLSRSAVIRMIGYDESRSREEEEKALKNFFNRAGVAF